MKVRKGKPKPFASKGLRAREDEKWDILQKMNREISQETQTEINDSDVYMYMLTY